VNAAWSVFATLATWSLFIIFVLPPRPRINLTIAQATFPLSWAIGTGIGVILGASGALSSSPSDRLRLWNFYAMCVVIALLGLAILWQQKYLRRLRAVAKALKTRCRDTADVLWNEIIGGYPQVQNALTLCAEAWDPNNQDHERTRRNLEDRRYAIIHDGQGTFDAKYRREVGSLLNELAAANVRYPDLLAFTNAFVVQFEEIVAVQKFLRNAEAE
jgi:hypothetical protein